MHLKLISSAALALSLLSGAAIAQTQTDSAPETSGQASTNPSTELWASPEEQAMYEANRDRMSVFFVDDTWTAWRTEAEMQTAWEAMSAEDQAAVASSCTEAVEAKTTLGPASTSICGWAGVDM